MNSLAGLLRCCFCLVAVAAPAFLAGCQTPGHTFPDGTSDVATGTNGVAGGTPVSVPPNPAATDKINNSIDFALRPGYKVTITFSGISSPPPKHEEKIREDGYISPPLLKRPVLAAGKTIGKLQDELQELYVPDYFKTLTVTVTTEDRFFFVGGEVRSPGPKPYLPEMTVLKAIQQAGGFTDFARRRKVLIFRANGGRQETINCDKATKNPKFDKPIFPDDRIDVNKRLW
jgi:polysaccharide export outer membrane protein